MTTIEEILTELHANGISQQQIELAMELRPGDIGRANLIDDPEVIALLRMIKAFPWLIKVADRNFDEDYAKRTMLHASIDVLMNGLANKKNSSANKPM